MINEQVLLDTEKFLSPKVFDYRKSYSIQHVITSLIEDWPENLDQNILVGAVLADFSKAFDYILHEFLIAKLAAFGFNLNPMALILTYLKIRKQSVWIKSKHSSFENKISGMHQWLLVGPILLSF